MEKAFKGLDSALIDSLMAGSRNHNAYGPKLVEFCESDEAGVNVAETWPEFKGKLATTLYQGFRTAASKAELDNTVRILNRDGQVYLLHIERVALAQAAA